MSEKTDIDDLRTAYRAHVRAVSRGRFTTMYGIMSDLLRQAWCRGTAAPAHQQAWTPENAAVGQDAVSALVVQDLMGGTIVRAVLTGIGPHYWIELPNGEDVHVYDPTRAHLARDIFIPRGEAVTREHILDPDVEPHMRTGERYVLLKRRLMRVFAA